MTKDQSDSNQKRSPRSFPFSEGEHAGFWSVFAQTLLQEKRLRDFQISVGTIETAKSYHFQLHHRDGALEILADRLCPGRILLCVSSGELAAESAVLIAVLQDIFEGLECNTADISLIDREDVFEFVA